jgi:anti-sigma factor RsiW
MSRTDGNTKRCTKMENKLVEYLDGRAKPSERHAVEEHLAACAECRTRAEDFRALWDVLDDLPVLDPSSAFDASLRARIAAEPVRRRFWDLLPSPRLAFATAALIALSVLTISMSRVTSDRRASEPSVNKMSEEANFRMIRDLPVLENYDLLSKFDALSELPTSPAAAPGDATKESR